MARLNADILEKMHRKTGKPHQHIRVRISQKASQQGISSIAAQLLWARDLGIGIGSALNRNPEVRDEIRGLSSSAASGGRHTRAVPAAARPKSKAKAITAVTIK